MMHSPAIAPSAFNPGFKRSLSHSICFFIAFFSSLFFIVDSTPAAFSQQDSTKKKQTAAKDSLASSTTAAIDSALHKNENSSIVQQTERQTETLQTDSLDVVKNHITALESLVRLLEEKQALVERKLKLSKQLDILESQKLTNQFGDSTNTPEWINDLFRVMTPEELKELGIDEDSRKQPAMLEKLKEIETTHTKPDSLTHSRKNEF